MGSKMTRVGSKIGVHDSRMPRMGGICSVPKNCPNVDFRLHVNGKFDRNTL